jgi:hypothetical protein
MGEGKGGDDLLIIFTLPLLPSHQGRGESGYPAVLLRVFLTIYYLLFTIYILLMAEREGFEPSVKLLDPTHDFQSCSFSLSDISPLIVMRNE